LITADHGNAEELLTFPTATYFYTSQSGTINTDHSNNPVPLVVVGKTIPPQARLNKGALSDVAPTILTMMGIEVPSEMTGKSLFAS